MTASLLPLLAARTSPTQFDPEHVVGSDEVDVLLEAARWAPSAGNSQPWSFLMARRGGSDHARLVRHLAGSARRWVPSAGLLVANLCHRRVEGTDWEYSEFSAYDLGQAVAHMTVQAQYLGLSARQFRAFDRAGVERELDVPPHWGVTTMTAFGRPAVHEGDAVERARRPPEDLVWPTD